MKPIEELRAAHAATTQGEWGKGHATSTAVYKGRTSICICQCFITDSNVDSFPADNAAFIALAHNEFPALLDEIETLRRKLAQWESVFGHLGDTPDACGNTIIARQDEADAEIERLRVLAGHGRWEITASDDSQYLYVQHDWAGGHGQLQIKAEAEGYIVDIFDEGDNCVASTSAMYHELDNEA